jgi:hypothetical protein
MSDKKQSKEQLNEILKKKNQENDLSEKAMPLRQPPASLSQQDNNNSKQGESNSVNSTQQNSDKKEDK